VNIVTGASIGNISSSLNTSVTKSATLGTAAHDNKTKLDPVYASMFKTSKKPEEIKFDAFWGQGSMAGVLGSR
jgi:hypothetical protein